MKVDMGGIGQGGEFVTVNLDTSFRARPDIVDDITTVVFPDESIEVIRCIHTLEHLYFDQVMLTLKRWHAMLIPGGKLQIVVPDNEAILADNLPFEIKMALLYANPHNHSSAGVLEVHKWGYSFNSLERLLLEVGFSDVYPGTFHRAYWEYDYPYPKMERVYLVPNLMVEAVK